MITYVDDFTSEGSNNKFADATQIKLMERVDELSRRKDSEAFSGNKPIQEQKERAITMAKQPNIGGLQR